MEVKGEQGGGGEVEETRRDKSERIKKEKKASYCITIWVTSLCFTAPILVSFR